MLIIFAVVLVGAMEFGRLLASETFGAGSGLAAASHYRWLMPLLTLIGIFAVLCFEARPAPEGDPDFFVKLVSALYFITLLFSAFALTHWIYHYERGNLKVSAITRLLFAVVSAWLLMTAWISMVQLWTQSPWALLAVMALVWLADIAAYFAGRFFGMTKLAPKTSPGKTRAGAVGAFVAVTVYAAALAPAVMPHMHLFLGMSELASSAIWFVAFWILTALSMIGDLYESLIKRLAGQKDSGTILPGHGGALDRIDSLLTTLPVAALMLLWAL
jgi:phosphatidate cytidylyltransferase